MMVYLIIKNYQKNYHVEKYENERNLHNLSMKIVTVPTTEMEKFKKKTQM